MSDRLEHLKTIFGDKADGFEKVGPLICGALAGSLRPFKQHPTPALTSWLTRSLLWL